MRMLCYGDKTAMRWPNYFTMDIPMGGHNIALSVNVWDNVHVADVNFRKCCGVIGWACTGDCAKAKSTRRADERAAAGARKKTATDALYPVDGYATARAVYAQGVLARGVREIDLTTGKITGPGGTYECGPRLCRDWTGSRCKGDPKAYAIGTAHRPGCKAFPCVAINARLASEREVRDETLRPFGDDAGLAAGFAGLSPNSARAPPPQSPPGTAGVTRVLPPGLGAGASAGAGSSSGH